MHSDVLHSDVWLWAFHISDPSRLVQLFALQMESRDQREVDEMVHHRLPIYVQNMDRLGDTDL